MNDEDIVIEDATYRATRKHPAEKPDNTAQKPPIQSELAKQSQPKKILDRILKTPLTMSVGEVIGTSHEVSNQLQELMRIKWPNTVNPTAKADLISAAIITT
ncbi:hypothetical protein LXA43DRAFT_905219 [Ganoderma leucocontextum]|nr:hypothetical protein LXA43DRAFT_905219 [Ganoderma leucocontextum]